MRTEKSVRIFMQSGNWENQLQHTENHQRHPGGDEKTPTDFLVFQCFFLILLILPTHIEPRGTQQTDKGRKNQPDNRNKSHNEFLLRFLIVYRKAHLPSRLKHAPRLTAHYLADFYKRFSLCPRHFVYSFHICINIKFLCKNMLTIMHIYV